MAAFLDHRWCVIQKLPQRTIVRAVLSGDSDCTCLNQQILSSWVLYMQMHKAQSFLLNDLLSSSLHVCPSNIPLCTNKEFFRDFTTYMGFQTSTSSSEISGIVFHIQRLRSFGMLPHFSSVWSCQSDQFLVALQLRPISQISFHLSCVLLTHVHCCTAYHRLTTILSISAKGLFPLVRARIL